MENHKHTKTIHFGKKIKKILNLKKQKTVTDLQRHYTSEMKFTIYFYI